LASWSRVHETGERVWVGGWVRERYGEERLEGKITDYERIVPLVGESSCARGTIAKLTVYLQQNQLPPQEPLPAPAAVPFLQLPTSQTSPSKRRYVADVQVLMDIMRLLRLSNMERVSMRRANRTARCL